MKIEHLLYRSKGFVKRNGSTILTCVGAAGVVATSVMAVKATPKAIALLEQAEEEKGEELTKLEKVNVAGPVYIPAVLMGTATIACVFGANVLNKRQQAALMSAYALLDNSYKEYKNKVEELYGEDANDNVTAAIVKDKYEDVDISVEEDKLLFYDLFSERYFESTMEKVLKAEMFVNQKISRWGGASLNDFYEELGIDPVDYGEFLGWSGGGLAEMYWDAWLDFDHKVVPLEDGMECRTIEFGYEPMYDYEYY